jgi:hypothetical protein
MHTYAAEELSPTGAARSRSNLDFDLAAHRPRNIPKTGSDWKMMLQFANTLLQDRMLFCHILDDTEPDTPSDCTAVSGVAYPRFYATKMDGRQFCQTPGCNSLASCVHRSSFFKHPDPTRTVVQRITLNPL